ncbi:MAG TPA: hypothetical protein VG962_03505 [Steroidobacteraceae bacterium]|nr:hypothetical protein [Steroidobacteraceae bacterium]
MNQDQSTHDEFAAELSRLFAEQNEPLPDHEFTQQLLSHLDHEYRMQQVRRWCAVGIVLLLAAMLAPLMVHLTAGLFSLASHVSRLQGMNTIAVVGMVLASGIMFLRARRQI